VPPAHIYSPRTGPSAVIALPPTRSRSLAESELPADHFQRASSVAICPSSTRTGALRIQSWLSSEADHQRVQTQLLEHRISKLHAITVDRLNK